MDVTRLIFQRIDTAGAGDPARARLLGAAVPAVLAACLDETSNPALRDAVAASPPGALERLGEAPLSARQPQASATPPLDAGRTDAIARALAGALNAEPALARQAVDRAAELAVAGIAEAGRAQGLGAEESLRMFAKQAGSVATALPAGLAEALLDHGLLNGLGGRTRQALAGTRPAGGATERPSAPVLPAEPGPSWWRWVIPATAVTVTLAIAATFLRGV